MTTTVLALAASGWALLMALSPLLQLRAMRRAGHAEGVSLGYFAVLLVGFVLWVAYGVAIGDPALVVPNTVAAGVAVLTMAVVRRYRRRARVAPAGATRARPAGSAPR